MVYCSFIKIIHGNYKKAVFGGLRISIIQNIVDMTYIGKTVIKTFKMAISTSRVKIVKKTKIEKMRTF